MINVAIVEDDPGLRESIAMYIGGTPGFTCTRSFGSGEEAMAALSTDCPDVVLMDINLTGMSGIECARRLKHAQPKVQILMLTVFGDSDPIFQALAAGASGYLLKRVPPAKLIEAIQEVHEGGSPMSGTIARKVVQRFQSAPHPASECDGLSPREQQVLELLAKGCAYKQIAAQLGISIDTIRTYIRRIYEKLQVRSRTEAVARYLTR